MSWNMHTIRAVWEPTVTKYSWMEGKKAVQIISTKPLKISSNVTSAHVTSPVAFGAKQRENAMLSQVCRLTELFAFLNPAVDQSGWGGGANHLNSFRTYAYGPNRYHQPRENTSYHFHTQNIAGEYLVFLFLFSFFLKSLSQKEHTSCDMRTNTAI